MSICYFPSIPHFYLSFPSYALTNTSILHYYANHSLLFTIFTVAHYTSFFTSLSFWLLITFYYSIFSHYINIKFFYQCLFNSRYSTIYFGTSFIIISVSFALLFYQYHSSVLLFFCFGTRYHLFMSLRALHMKLAEHNLPFIYFTNMPFPAESFPYPLLIVREVERTATTESVIIAGVNICFSYISGGFLEGNQSV